MSDVGYADRWLGWWNEAARRTLQDDMARIEELRAMFAAAAARADAAEAAFAALQSSAHDVEAARQLAVVERDQALKDLVDAEDERDHALAEVDALYARARAGA